MQAPVIIIAGYDYLQSSAPVTTFRQFLALRLLSLVLQGSQLGEAHPKGALCRKASTDLVDDG